ncbi:RNA polymerase recycling motor HelD [Paenibacillus sp. J2TS4]|uniref:RNA polymerase recycling motor HelD n=1 Tax=Paenibacillus sp. J2TS4 TaxID=2807194 RepID=UPI001B26DC25|nr:RNA polymerase recycling motor HelD [Paenibacillus sp. J2TS4]GIP34856.1 DNA helicase [Paenibacillus sp. J2TS4]
MSLTEQDWQEEKQRVEHVEEEIDSQIAVLQEHVSDKRAETVDVRKNFWDDVTVNLEDPSELVETYASIKQQAEVLSEKERSYEHAYNQLKILTKLKQSPYFGRVDFLEEGQNKAEPIYLGISSLYDEDKMEFLIYDWRAPLSSLYYDYALGPAHYETPGGTVSGKIELKRQYTIRDGQFISMFDTGVTIGDELLQEVLGKQADSQMRSIVATIQKEQNQIIRNERSRLLIVQGAAGSGKTSAALQRVAYLLYRYRETLKAEHIVLFSPNMMFNSYVSTVLPELGEENMQQTTFQQFLDHRLGRHFQLGDPFAQLEYEYIAMNEPGYEARMEGIRYKASARFMELVEKYLSFLGREGILFKSLKFRGKTLVSAAKIRERFYALDSAISIPNRMQLLSEWLLGELREREKAERNEPWVEDEIELLDNDAYQRAYQKLRKQNRFSGESFDDYERERELLAIMIVREQFKGLRQRVKKLRFVNIPGVYRQLFAEPQYAHRFSHEAELPEHWKEICAQTVERLDRSELAYEDATPYLFLQEKIEGFQTNNLIRHVFMDEAQDYSPFQFAFIQRLFPRSKMTVLGDLNQAIFTHTETGGHWQTLEALYGEEQTERFILTRSYRSTRQIIDFTRDLIPEGHVIEPFNREGSKPTLTQAADEEDLNARVAERIQALQKAGLRTIAVICKSAKESREAFQELTSELGARLIEKDAASFEPGVLVIPAYLAKGVEFDAVILYNASQEQYGREGERRLFYTACTRAMHELHLYYIGTRSRFLDDVSPDTYLAGNLTEQA